MDSAMVVTVMSSSTMNCAAHKMTSGPQDIRGPGWAFRACHYHGLAGRPGDVSE